MSMSEVSRHEFLAALHKLLQPKVYLEIGVQYGQSLVLAGAADMAIGIDPEPLLFAAPQNQLPNQSIFKMTSDDFFRHSPGDLVLPPVDLAFIDGSHLFEDAMCDYVNVQKHMRPKGVIVFDDVLPYSQDIATRVQPPGDWTGDVWKCFFILETMHRRGRIVTPPILVDTWPTGTMVLLDVEPKLSLSSKYSDKGKIREWYPDEIVPAFILERTHAVEPIDVLEIVRERMV
jgi:hypothetical protein